MNKLRWTCFAVSLVSLGLGVLAIVPVVRSENGYVGSIVILPMFLMVAVATLILGVFGIAMLVAKKSAAPFFLTSALLIPCGFFGGAMVSKYFEIGAYYQGPMSPIVPAVANKVVFKKDATHDEVQDFWRTVLSEPHNVSGSWPRPGVRGISSNLPENGHEVITFVFFETATDEQKAELRNRIMAYPSVMQYHEGVDTSIVTTEPEPPKAESPDNLNRIPKREPSNFVHRQ
jgi:hypothetical protein